MQLRQVRETLIPRLFAVPRPEAGAALHSADQLQLRRRIELAQASCERNDHTMCLIVFHMARGEFDRRERTRLQTVIIERMRKSDEAGWLDDVRLAVLMPQAKPAGAERLRTDIHALFGVDRPVLPSEILVYPEVARRKGSGSDATPLPTAEPVPPAPLSALERVLAPPLPGWKRAMDVVGASVLLLLLAPVLLAAALLVKLSSRGPVLFRQRRAGRFGVPFVLFKFRTMVNGAEAMRDALRDHNEMTGPLFKLRRDPRVTRIGAWLRRTSIDELPQLWNVLRGDMSLVGPRPATLDEVAVYEPWQRRRLAVAQGLTGKWQVEGRGRIGFPESVRMDLRYAERASLLDDVRILLRTVSAVASARGAH